MPEGAVYVGPGSLWSNPFGPLRTRQALARTPAISHPDHEWEYEGRISADGMRHDYHHADGSVTPAYVRYMTAAEAVECYRALLHGDGRWPLDFTHAGRHYPHIRAIGQLRGKDLVCWCAPGDSCHADVLLELANSDLQNGPAEAA